MAASQRMSWNGAMVLRGIELRAVLLLVVSSYCTYHRMINTRKLKKIPRAKCLVRDYLPVIKCADSVPSKFVPCHCVPPVFLNTLNHVCARGCVWFHRYLNLLSLVLVGDRWTTVMFPSGLKRTHSSTIDDSPAATMHVLMPPRSASVSPHPSKDL